MAKANWLKVDPSQGSGNATEMVHSGDIDDPIPYVAPMEILKGKYYTEDGVKFICTRDSGIALTHSLNDLVGIYVEFV